jgi:acyl carrier protein
VGVARGYLGRAALTAERFVPDRFGGRAGARLYRTGDRVRYRADGSLQYLGRLDQQVKVRGYRIELGEIESACLKDRSVQDAVAMVREDQPEQPQVVLYVVARTPEAPDQPQAPLQERLQPRLKEQLPRYMQPSAIVVLEALPLTPNGKLDRKALPEPGALLPARTYVAPQGPIEQRLAGLWEALLKRKPISRHDNFFELGGHSLLVTQLASRIQDTFCIPIEIKTLYKYSTVAEVAARVEHLLEIQSLAEDAIEQMTEEEAARVLESLETLEDG